MGSGKIYPNLRALINTCLFKFLPFQPGKMDEVSIVDQNRGKSQKHFGTEKKYRLELLIHKLTVSH